MPDADPTLTIILSALAVAAVGVVEVATVDAVIVVVVQATAGHWTYHQGLFAM